MEAIRRFVPKERELTLAGPLRGPLVHTRALGKMKYLPRNNKQRCNAGDSRIEWVGEDETLAIGYKSDGVCYSVT